MEIWAPGRFRTNLLLLVQETYLLSRSDSIHHPILGSRREPLPPPQKLVLNSDISHVSLLLCPQKSTRIISMTRFRELLLESKVKLRNNMHEPCESIHFMTKGDFLLLLSQIL